MFLHLTTLLVWTKSEGLNGRNLRSLRDAPVSHSVGRVDGKKCRRQASPSKDFPQPASGAYHTQSGSSNTGYLSTRHSTSLRRTSAASSSKQAKGLCALPQLTTPWVFPLATL